MDDLTSADLQELLDEQAVENVRLEFKLERPDKDETLKKLSSFANTFDGYLIIGAKANSADGVLTELPVIVEPRGFKQQIVQWCYDAASPPIELFVSPPIPAPSDATKVCYVIYVPESEEAPHFLNSRKGVYIRTDEFSQRFQALLATYDEIQHLANRRAATVERKERLIKRAEERFDVFVTMKNDPNQPGYTGAPKATLKLAISPLFPSRILLSQGKLLSLIQNTRVSWRGTTFPLVTTSPLSQHESALILEADGQTYTLLEANVWGLLFYVCEIELELSVGSNQTAKAKGIHLYALLGRLLVFLEHAHQSYGAMGYDGTLEMRVALERMRGIPFLYSSFGNFIDEGPSSQLDDKISFVLSFPSSRLQTNRDAIAADLLRVLFFAVNWPAMVDQDERINALLVLDHS